MDALREIRSAVVATLKALRIFPIVIASIIVTGWGFRFLAMPGLSLALIVALVFGGSLLHRRGRST
jgi:hypothetical protein